MTANRDRPSRTQDSVNTLGKKGRSSNSHVETQTREATPQSRGSCSWHTWFRSLHILATVSSCVKEHHSLSSSFRLPSITRFGDCFSTLIVAHSTRNMTVYCTACPTSPSKLNYRFGPFPATPPVDQLACTSESSKSCGSAEWHSHPTCHGIADAVCFIALPF